MLSSPEIFFLPNLILVLPSINSTDSFSIFGHTILNHHKHEVLGINEEMLDFWTVEESFRLNNDLYPDKTRNVMGRKFVFAVLKYSPFSLVLTEKNETVFDGFETRIAAMFVNLMNGTWEGLDHPDLWGELFPNGTGTGVINSIVGKDLFSLFLIRFTYSFIFIYFLISF